MQIQSFLFSTLGSNHYQSCLYFNYIVSLHLLFFLPIIPGLEMPILRHLSHFQVSYHYAAEPTNLTHVFIYSIIYNWFIQPGRPITRKLVTLDGKFYFIQSQRVAISRLASVIFVIVRETITTR